VVPPEPDNKEVVMASHTDAFGRSPAVGCAISAAAVAFLICTAPDVVIAAPGDDQLVSVGEITGNAAGGQTGRLPLSGNGRYALFYSTGSTVVPGDTNGVYDVYLRDLVTNTTERISVGLGGVEPDGHSDASAISFDGRYVVFGSNATNIVADDSSGAHQVYVRDRWTGLTERAFIGASPPSDTWWGGISDDGRFVTFESGAGDRYITDRQARTTTKIGPGSQCEISGNGQYVVFATAHGNRDLYTWDRLSGTTRRISKVTVEEPFEFGASISDDGRWVSFQSYGHEAPEDQDYEFSQDVFLWDRVTGTTRLVNVSPGGAQDNGSPNAMTSVSNDGRYVAFASTGTNLFEGASTGLYSTNIFVKDMQTGAMERVSGDAYSMSLYPSFSDDGRLVAFTSTARFVTNDTNADQDAYLHEIGQSSSSLPGAPSLYLRPLSIEYGQVALGTALKKGFTLTNAGTGALPITTIELLGVDRSQYVLRSYCGSSLAVGAHCWISVAFQPTSVGYKQANLHVVAGGIERHRALRGTGIR
jgi:Tol biopolymer transport system component